MNHLTPDELIDAAEDVLDAARRRHLGTCEFCGKEVEALRALLREAAGVEVPEPSSLFWDHFSARVRQAVAEERSPAGALAAVLMAMVATVARGPVPATAPETSAGVVSPDAAVDVWLEDEDWAVLADLLGPVDWDTAGEAGLALWPGDAELAVLSLSEDEQRELSRLLAGEIERSKS